MRSEQYMQQGMGVLSEWGANLPRKALVGGILMVSLLAFEMFNFDTTQYALGNLLGWRDAKSMPGDDECGHCWADEDKP